MFEDPVTEAIAPGYFEVVDVPMDYATVEKKVEEQVYKDKEQVSSLGKVCSDKVTVDGMAFRDGQEVNQRELLYVAPITDWFISGWCSIIIINSYTINFF